DLASRPNGTDPGAGQLGGLTLLPGVYKSASGAFLITGSDLTLDAQGNANAVWIFQMASSLTVGTPLASRSVILVNGAQPSNVYWQVGSAATINGAGGGSMAGTIIASEGMTFSTAGNATVTTLNGRALGLFAAITMVNAVIKVNGVPATVVVPSITVTGSAAADVVPVAGNGFMTINSTATGAVTVTNTGNGHITVNATGAAAVTITHT